MGAPGHYILCPKGHEIGVIEDDLYWDDKLFEELEELEKKKCPICGQNAKYNFCHYGQIDDCTSVKLAWNPKEKRWIIPKKLAEEQKKELELHIIRKDRTIKTEKVIKDMTVCENCKKEKEVTEIEGHMLCKDCSEEIVKCDHCGKFLGISYDDLTAGNYGKLSVPELSLPDQITNVVFCNLEHLEEYLKKYKEENEVNIYGRCCHCTNE